MAWAAYRFPVQSALPRSWALMLLSVICQCVCLSVTVFVYVCMYADMTCSRCEAYLGTPPLPLREGDSEPGRRFHGLGGRRTRGGGKCLLQEANQCIWRRRGKHSCSDQNGMVTKKNKQFKRFSSISYWMRMYKIYVFINKITGSYFLIVKIFLFNECFAVFQTLLPPLTLKSKTQC